MSFKGYSKKKKKNSRKKNKKKSNRHALERLAYQMGMIERGMANENSKVFESFQKGLAVPNKKERKPLL